MSEVTIPHAGDVWDASLDPVHGHEQSGFRPVVIISADWYNQTPHGLCIIVPLTRSHKGVQAHTEIDNEETGLHSLSYALGEQVRAISVKRLRRRRGFVTPDILAQLRKVVREFLVD